MPHVPRLQLDEDQRLLLVAAVRRELRPLGVETDAAQPWRAAPIGRGVEAVISGVGRANAAAAVAWNLARRDYAFVLSVGVCGALPGSGLKLGDVVAAEKCVFHEEGLLAPDGFHDMAALGFPLGPFEGNRAPCSPALLESLRAVADRVAPIATVATCSGTDAAAESVRARTGAAAEAMEGAAVVATALRLGVAAGELRAVSNTTGDRAQQQWDLDGAVEALAEALRRLVGL